MINRKKNETFCNQNNIHIITAPAKKIDIELLERLTQTTKGRLRCTILANTNNKFSVEELIKSIVYQLPICKQKATNEAHFQAHIDRKPNIPISSIGTVPQSSKLTYEQTLNHSSDADIVPVEHYIEDNGLVSGEDRKITCHVHMSGPF